MATKLHFRKDDQVKVIAGKEKGKTGKILMVLSKKESAIVEKINFVKKHSRPSGKNRQGGILEKEAPLPLSNLMIICTKCNMPVRIGRRILDDNKKVRHCKKCGEILES